MSRMSAGIILQGQTPNMLQAIDMGNMVAARQLEGDRARRLDTLFQEQGAGIMAGEQGALQAYAGIDPQAALGVRREHQQMRISEERLQMARAAGAREAEAMRRAGQEAELEREAQMMDRGLAQLQHATDPRAWNQIASQSGLEHLVMETPQQWEQRENVIAMELAALEGAVATFDRMQGQGTDVPAGYQALELRAQAAGLQPETPEYQQFMLEGGRQGEGFEVVTNADGSTSVRYGSGVGQGQPEQQSDPLDPTPTMLEDIGRAISIIESNPSMTTGVGGALLSDLPGTQARDVRALIDTIRANVGFQSLQRMRDQSPTGGALGQVTERELALLQATLGNLEQAQTGEQLLFNLRRLEGQIGDIVHGPGGTSAVDAPEAESVTTPSAPQVGVTEDGYRFLGGDPADPASWERVE